MKIKYTLTKTGPSIKWDMKKLSEGKWRYKMPRIEATFQIGYLKQFLEVYGVQEPIMALASSCIYSWLIKNPTWFAKTWLKKSFKCILSIWHLSRMENSEKSLAKAQQSQLYCWQQTVNFSRRSNRILRWNKQRVWNVGKVKRFSK